MKILLDLGLRSASVSSPWVTRAFQTTAALRLSEIRTPNETKILEILKTKFPEAQHLDVKEGGQSCGDTFEVYVSTKEFKGKSKVKQHQMVIQHIREIVKDAHVVRVSSEVPPE